MDRTSDLSISGMGKVNGGTYRDVSISGMGEVDGDLTAETLKISGMGTVTGNSDVKKVRISGMATLNGSLTTENLKNSGTMDVMGDLKARDLDVNGNCNVKGSVRSETINIQGFFNTGGGVEAEEFNARGSFKIKDLLNAQKVDIKFGWACYAREIGGEDIKVRHGLYNLSFLLELFSKNRLETELIEGNTISLEYTNAKVVRGDRVRIGDKCTIDTVEYTTSLDVEPGATVRNRVKL